MVGRRDSPEIEAEGLEAVDVGGGNDVDVAVVPVLGASVCGPRLPGPVHFNIE